MTEREANTVINELMKALWPRWDCTAAQRGVWVNRLRLYPPDVAKVAIRQAYEQSPANRLSPSPKLLIEKLGALFTSSRHSAKEQPFGYTNIAEGHRWYVRRLDQEQGKPVFISDPDQMSETAEQVRQRHEEIYGEKYIVVREAIAADDGLRGQAAKEEAERQILTGPDTPGKRFLFGLVLKKKQKKLPGPVRLGEALTGLPF